MFDRLRAWTSGWRFSRRTLVSGLKASHAMARERASWNREPIRKRIDKAVRHAVAVGFRRYERLSAKAGR
jgi:hypothetical protein